MTNGHDHAMGATDQVAQKTPVPVDSIQHAVRRVVTRDEKTAPCVAPGDLSPRGEHERQLSGN